MLIKNQQINLTIKSSSVKESIITGYASVFDICDNHNDIISHGAFATDMASNNVKLLWQHDQTKPIGVVSKIKEDNYGLYIEAIINKQTEQGKEAVALIEQGAVDGLSIGFKIEDSKYDKAGIRNILAAKLYEVSIVTFPANEQACISRINKSLEKAINILNQI